MAHVATRKEVDLDEDVGRGAVDAHDQVEMQAGSVHASDYLLI